MDEPIRPSQRPAAGHGTAAPRSPLTLDDLAADLIWPKLLRIGRMSLRPARVGLGAIWFLGCQVLLSLGNRIDGDADRDLLRQGLARMGRHAAELGGAVISAPPRMNDAANRLVDIFLRDPAAIIRDATWPVVVAIPLLLVWTVILGGAMVRTAATELAWSRTTSWPEAVGLALRRWKSLVGSAVLPLAVMWMVVLGLAGLSWALFNLPVLRFVGALGWGMFLFGGLVVAVLALGYLLGQMMLAPGVMCEGADTIDSVQHAYAMGLGRPLRLVSYLAILAAQAAVVGVLVALVLGGASLAAQAAAHAGAGDRGDAIIAAARDGGFVPADAKARDVTSPDRGAQSLVKVWTSALVVAGMGAAASYWWCAATGLFLAMRRVCDGQEFSELWSPGMVEGTVAESSQVRVGPGGEARSGAAISEAVVDDGPADEG